MLVTACLAVSGAGAATTAQAAFGDCPSGRVCLWGNNDYQFLLSTQTEGGGLKALSGDANNNMDSWGNRTARAGAGHDGSNGSGDCQTFSAGSRDNNVAPFNSDEVSSFRANRGC